MTKVAIVYYSGFKGVTEKIAEAVAQGARQVPETQVITIHTDSVDNHWQDLGEADAIDPDAPTCVLLLRRRRGRWGLCHGRLEVRIAPLTIATPPSTFLQSIQDALVVCGEGGWEGSHIPLERKHRFQLSTPRGALAR